MTTLYKNKHIPPIRKLKCNFKINRLISNNRNKKSTDEEFALTNKSYRNKKTSVRRVLPSWIQNPFYVKRDLDSLSNAGIENFPQLHHKLKDLLRKHGINSLFPVQDKVIPQLLQESKGVEMRYPPRDICVATPTGSGKTLAYVLPIIQEIGMNAHISIRAIVILPVMELAMQVYKVFFSYASAFNIKVIAVLGKDSYVEEKSKLVKIVGGNYSSKVHIIVGTPGRILEHLNNTPGLNLSHLRYLVLDEADKLITGENGEIIYRIQKCIMKSKNFPSHVLIPPLFPLAKSGSSNILECQPTVEDCHLEDQLDPFRFLFNQHSGKLSRILEYKSLESEVLYIPKPPLQKLLFSATLSVNPEYLQNIDLNRPILFCAMTESQIESLESFNHMRSKNVAIRPVELTEEYVLSDISLKPLLLYYLLKSEMSVNIQDFKALVFSGSVELTLKLAVILKALAKDAFTVEEFSAKQRERKVTFSKFTKGHINVLVSTDAMARGMDFRDINCVISYDVPSLQTYIHRIGRTARAGTSGKAISLVTAKECSKLQKILSNDFYQLSERKYEKDNLDELRVDFQSALLLLRSSLKKKSGNKRKITKMFDRKKTIRIIK